jgi:hypothetical protein
MRRLKLSLGVSWLHKKEKESETLSVCVEMWKLRRLQQVYGLAKPKKSSRVEFFSHKVSSGQ